MRHPHINRFASAVTLLVGSLAVTSVQAGEVIEASVGTEYEAFDLVQVVDGFTHPWAVGFLPDDRMLITEKGGKLYIAGDNARATIHGLPDDLYSTGQGGLLDVVVHPDHDDNGWIYFTYSQGNENATVPALFRARLDGNELVDHEQLFASNTPTGPGRHYGSRILFLDDNTLLMTIGDRGAEPPRAQDTQDHSGSVVRLNHDGSVPDDNPFVDDDDVLDEIYSYGHRNIQGIVQHPDTGAIWATEHGPRGGDELNLIRPGGNYGWPTVTQGRDYGTEDTFPDAEARAMEGMTAPVFEFLPTLAPSGLAVVSGDTFPAWDGNLLAGGLRAERILRLVIEDETVLHAEELLLQTIGRIRDIRQGPDGNIYVLNDEDEGALYRLQPAD